MMDIKRWSFQKKHPPVSTVGVVQPPACHPLQPLGGLYRMGPPDSRPRAGWRKFGIEPPFKLGKPFRQLRGDTRVTPEDKQRLAEQRAAEIAKRRADFNANYN